jgi:hypothetical protein
MTRTRTPSVIPAGHTFLNPSTFISQKGHDTVRDLLRKADNRNPDLFNMYIFNGTSQLDASGVYFILLNPVRIIVVAV